MASICRPISDRRVLSQLTSVFRLATTEIAVMAAPSAAPRAAVRMVAMVSGVMVGLSRMAL